MTTHSAPALALRQRSFLIAVAGNPNCGKTTLFNALTGLRHKVGNYPGVTVEKREGAMAGEPSIRLLDLPGTYSLSARSLDEQICRDVLLGRLPDTAVPDAVMIVVDATNLTRNLYLAGQVIELGLPAVLVCNMMDLLRQGGSVLDLDVLSRLLGVPIVSTVGHRGEGVAELRAALKAICAGGQTNSGPRRWRLGDAMESEIATVAEAIAASGFTRQQAADGAAVLLLSEGQLPEENNLPATLRTSLSASLERLSAQPDVDLSLEVTSSRYAWLDEVVQGCLKPGQVAGASMSDRLDRILTHKVWGLVIFAGMMAVLFYSIFVLADPLMRLIEGGVGWAQDEISALLPAGLLRGLIREGVVAGVGNVVVFFPQICILFLFIAILEDTGYMARAAFLMDRIMSRVGLHGKSFIPLLSCHACAIPGIMATRTIESPKDRLATILVAPLMSCSARLPVYTVLIAACLPGGAWVKAGTMLAMYGLGIASALTMATFFKKTLLKGPTPAFIMELPPYRVPHPAAMVRVMWDRGKLFLTHAGTTILAITIVLWALTTYPRSAERAAQFESLRAQVAHVESAAGQSALADLHHREASENLRDSYAGRLGHVIEPVIRPLGYDWRIGIGLIASFAAREVFVSTLGIIYSVGDQVDEESTPLREQVATATWPDGSRLFTPLVAVGLMVFYVLACQCISTIAVVRRETNSWRWPMFMLGYMSVLAYVAALIVHQAGLALGVGGG